MPALSDADNIELSKINKILAAMYSNNVFLNMPNIQRIVDYANTGYPESTPVLVTVDMLNELCDIVYRKVMGFI